MSFPIAAAARRVGRRTALLYLCPSRIGGGNPPSISPSTKLHSTLLPRIEGIRQDRPDCPRRFLSGSSTDRSDTGEKELSETTDITPATTEWIPPSRPLVGDKGYSHLYQKDEEEEETEEEELARLERELKALEEGDLVDMDQEIDDNNEEDNIMISTEEAIATPQRTNVDWLQTRRQRLGDEPPGQFLTPSYTPPGQDLPVLHHTLLTADEIMTYLSSLGGIKPNLVADKARNEQGDTRLGGSFRGIIFASGNSPSHVRMMSNSLVEQLKRRKLQEVGVMGARHGAEGSDDPDETWFCIDCHNYIVNIQDHETRRILDLEGWWSTGNPLAGYNLDNGLDNEDAVDEFVAQNPVPPEYGRSTTMDWNESINQLEQRRWTAPHKRDRRRIRSSQRGGKKKNKNRTRYRY
ncbi:Pfam:DUF143 [Seminavis robusta]|uniref:Pfam:DUF143 n=1 Tax=Seminavis robusta TaxID=568900 RepID=A0A9N8DJC7_9STRA|nr:Pfam:DUF143 [Seminavis robusta]|eukprot:Sro174_g076490.1 Pfam:DUF143 (408) ;mRNA; r:5322-6545